MQKVYTVASPEDFAAVIKAVLDWSTAQAVPTLVITLTGDLGAGKTTFTQQLGAFVGVLGPITSPTFTIMKTYEVPSEAYDSLVHIDAYRLESITEAKPLGFAELFTRPQTLVCIEWPEVLAPLIPAAHVAVAMTIGAGETRNVTVTFPK